MTHYPHVPGLWAVVWAAILVVISGVPAAAIVERTYAFGDRAGKVATAVLGPVWVVAWVQTTRLMARHGRLQREAAREHDCLGYAQLPERCHEAMLSEAVVPEHFVAWYGITLAFSVVGLAVIWRSEGGGEP